MVRPRRHLCSRCGAVLDDVVVDASTNNQGQCPSCGLGWTESGPLVAFRSSTTPSPADERRRQAALARIAQTHRDAMAECTFTVYGLDESWTGRRWFGGVGRRDDRLERLELAHGDAYDEDVALVRITSTWSYLDDAVRDRFAAQGLVQRLRFDTNDYTDAMRATFTTADPTASWDPLNLPVDGVFTPFRSLRSRAHWVALADIEGLLVELSARNVEPGDIRLLAVADLSAYLADDGLPR